MPFHIPQHCRNVVWEVTQSSLSLQAWWLLAADEITPGQALKTSKDTDSPTCSSAVPFSCSLYLTWLSEITACGSHPFSCRQELPRTVKLSYLYNYPSSNCTSFIQQILTANLERSALPSYRQGNPAEVLLLSHASLFLQSCLLAGVGGLLISISFQPTHLLGTHPKLPERLLGYVFWDVQARKLAHARDRPSLLLTKILMLRFSIPSFHFISLL